MASVQNLTAGQQKTSIAYVVGHMIHGPNYMWHVDGYDKLTPYGI